MQLDSAAASVRRPRIPAQPAGDGRWPSWNRLITALLHGEDLTPADTAWVMVQLLSGAASPAQIASFVVALHGKAATPVEIDGLISATRAHAVPVALPDQVARRAVVIGSTGTTHAQVANVGLLGAI